MGEESRLLTIFMPSLAGGGAEKSMLKLANGLADKGHRLDLVLAKAEGPYLPDVQANVRIVDLEASRMLSCLPAFVGYLRREKPDALLSALDFANIVAIWARKLAGVSTNLIVNDQNTISITSRNARQLRHRLVPLLMKLFYPWADLVIGNSQGVADDLHKVTGIPREQIAVIFNPVVLPELSEKAAAQLDHPWFQDGQPPVLLAVGRLTKQKDYPTMFRAFAEVRKSHPARLMILGEGPDRQMLEGLLRELNLTQDVSLPGFVDNPYNYMSNASLYVMSSGWEGLPTVLIEALFCGLPIVSTDCPSGPQEILAGGKYGTLVPVRDVNALAEAIKSALRGDVPQPTRESWQPYTLDSVVNQYVRVMIK